MDTLIAIICISLIVVSVLTLAMIHSSIRQVRRQLDQVRRILSGEPEQD